MSSVIKLAIKANMICVTASVICLIAAYIMNMGAWTIFGIRIFDALKFFMLAALLISFLQNIALKPIYLGQTEKLAMAALELSGPDELDMTQGQFSYAKGIIGKLASVCKTQYIVAGVIGCCAYFLIGPFIGSPISEIVALLILLLGPRLLGHLLMPSFMNLSKLDKRISHIALDFWSDVTKLNFGI